jgi:hypothetical protein
MSETSRCPHCGSPDGGSRQATAGHGRYGALDSLYREVARIREMAEARVLASDDGTVAGVPRARRDADDSQARIAALTREVAELRATVARLRGAPAAASLARSL